jgi:ubiquinone/menaquinone biosynthesis C-methylase UbiE
MKGTRVFEVCDSREFYGSIARNYDQRNSPNLLATHMGTIDEVDKIRVRNPALRVLDLGGGTGQNIATHFFNDRNMTWTYVDFCPEMIDQLKQHLKGRPLYERLTVHLDDIDRACQRLPGRSFDVVLLSLVLSSMPHPPDFTRISDLMAPDGLLVISDIDPQYTSAHPYYQATAADGTLVALRTRAIQPLDVITRATAAGLQLSGLRPGAPDADYSFIAVLSSPAAPGRPKYPLRRR